MNESMIMSGRAGGIPEAVFAPIKEYKEKLKVLSGLIIPTLVSAAEALLQKLQLEGTVFGEKIGPEAVLITIDLDAPKLIPNTPKYLNSDPLPRSGTAVAEAAPYESVGATGTHIVKDKEPLAAAVSERKQVEGEIVRPVALAREKHAEPLPMANMIASPLPVAEFPMMPAAVAANGEIAQVEAPAEVALAVATLSSESAVQEGVLDPLPLASNQLNTLPEIYMLTPEAQSAEQEAVEANQPLAKVVDGQAILLDPLPDLARLKNYEAQHYNELPLAGDVAPKANLPEITPLATLVQSALQTTAGMQTQNAATLMANGLAGVGSNEITAQPAMALMPAGGPGLVMAGNASAGMGGGAATGYAGLPLAV